VAPEKPEILLDVPMEDLLDILKDDDWNVDTVTRKLGSSTEERSDDNILRHAEETGCVVITVDGDFVPRLRAKNIDVMVIETDDKARIINEKLHKKFG